MTTPKISGGVTRPGVTQCVVGYSTPNDCTDVIVVAVLDPDVGVAKVDTERTRYEKRALIISKAV